MHKRALLVIMIIFLIKLISCTGTKNIKTNTQDWTYGKLIYVDTTEVEDNVLQFISIQVHPMPNGYQFEWLPDRKGTFRLGGLEIQEQYKLKILFGADEDLLNTKYISKNETGLIIDIPKRIIEKVKEIQTDDGLQKGKGRIKKGKT